MKAIFITIFSLMVIVTYGLQAAELKTVEDFTLKDYLNKAYTLSNYKDAKAIVLLFIATRCPVSNAYNERMQRLYEQFKDRGVVFFGINSNKAEDVQEVKKHAVVNKLTFPILKDPNNVIADRIKA